MGWVVRWVRGGGDEVGVGENVVVEELWVGGVIVKGKMVLVEILMGVEEGRGFLFIFFVDGGRVYWVGDNGCLVGVGDVFGVERVSKIVVGRVEVWYGKLIKRFVVLIRFRSGRVLVIDNKVLYVIMFICDMLVFFILCE